MDWAAEQEELVQEQEVEMEPPSIYSAAGGGPAWFVNVYSIDRVYGGPEEGGWWYDTGELVKVIVCQSEEQAQEVRQQLEAEYPYTGKRGSVLGGDDYNMEVANDPGVAYWPEERPHYE